MRTIPVSVAIAAFTATLATAAPQARDAASLLGKETYPESLAYDSRTDTLYVSGNGDGSIQTVHGGVAALFQPGGTDGRASGLGIKVDEARDRLWVVDRATIYVYQLATNTLIKKIPLASAVTVANPGLNDLALDRDGNAYVTDSFNPELLFVDGASLDLRVLRDLTGLIPYGTQNDFPYNLNGLVLAPDQRSLIAVKTNDGTLWRISLVDDRVARIALDEAVTKGDGLAWGAAGDLFIIRNFEGRISRVNLAAGRDDVARPVFTSAPDGLDVPTSAVFLAAPTPHLVLVNSQFDKDEPVLPFKLSSLDVGPER